MADSLKIKIDKIIEEIDNNIDKDIKKSENNKFGEITQMVIDLQLLYNKMGKIYKQALIKRKAELNNYNLLKSTKVEEIKTINTNVLNTNLTKNSDIFFSQKFKELTIEAYEKVQILRQIFTGEELTYLIGIEDSDTGELYEKEIDFKALMKSITIESELGNTIAKLKISSTAISNNMMQRNKSKLVIDSKQATNITPDVIALQSWKNVKNRASNNGIAFEIFKSQSLGLTYQLQNDKWYQGGDVNSFQLKFFGTTDKKRDVDLTDFSTCMKAIKDLLNMLKKYNSKNFNEEEIRKFFKAETLDKNAIVEGHIQKKVQEEYNKLVADLKGAIKDLKNLTKGK